MPLMKHPTSDLVQDVTDERAEVLAARGYTSITAEEAAALTGVAFPREAGLGTPEPVAAGLGSGAPAVNAGRPEWDLFARQKGLDPTNYESVEDIIEALGGTTAEGATQAQVPSTHPGDVAGQAGAGEGNGGGSPWASDAAAEAAEAEGLDASAIEGTGSGGKITKADVEKAAAAKAEA